MWTQSPKVATKMKMNLGGEEDGREEAAASKEVLIKCSQHIASERSHPPADLPLLCLLLSSIYLLPLFRANPRQCDLACCVYERLSMSFACVIESVFLHDPTSAFFCQTRVATPRASRRSEVFWCERRKQKQRVKCEVRVSLHEQQKQ